jgi:hypothetical protein
MPAPAPPLPADDPRATSAADSVARGLESDEATVGVIATAPALLNNEAFAKGEPEAQREDPFASGMTAYQARNFDEATRQFDLAAAQTGNQNAANWAARSVKDQSGCAAALERYDAVTQKAAGTQAGHDALFETANCQIALGQTDAARDKLRRLLEVPSHEARARQALGHLDAIATRKVDSKARAASPKPAAPARPAPAATPTPAAPVPPAKK